MRANECTCFLVPERYHTTHFGHTDPASMWEWNPDCPQHPAVSNQGAHDDV